jgi:ABC-type tungstate transport system permease subunit
VVFLLAYLRADAVFASEIDPTRRVRIAECFNSPPSVLLLLKINEAFLGLADAPPVWQTLAAETEEERRDLERASVVAVYDMLITSDWNYAENLREQGLLRGMIPIYTERLVLVGPTELFSDARGLPIASFMKKIFDEGRLFFSPMYNDWVSGEEKQLWERAGVAGPYDNKNYVESGHDDAGLLIQAEDERGFVLTGEASFAQYIDMQRGDPELIVLADAGIVRTTYACLIANSGYRKTRTETADRYADWLKSEECGALVDAFALGAIAPFSAAVK